MSDSHTLSLLLDFHLKKYLHILIIKLFSRSASWSSFPLSNLRLQNIRIPLKSRTTPLCNEPAVAAYVYVRVEVVFEHTHRERKRYYKQVLLTEIGA